MSLAGASLGIYDVGDELGRGAMGTVYRAQSTADGAAGPAGSVVALKVFHPELVADERAFERFRLEAEIGKEIHHDHLVRTHGIGHAEVDGAPYHFMVMELIEGRTLHALVSELGTLPEHLLFRVADQILAALHEIHARGVVHRDIKTENIVITEDHRVLVMDLGVARVQREAYGSAQPGEFIGSASYAAPEQFESEDLVTPRSDVYAVGAVLYELATGACPFDAGNFAALVREKVQGEVPRPRDRNPDLAVFWDEVIATCLEREPAKRFTSALELRTILQEGEDSEWWRLKSAGRAVPSAEQALKRLRLERNTPLVGRSKELELLHATLKRAREAGVVLHVGGPSGVGKSRLLYDFLEGVAGAGGPSVGAGRGVGVGGVAYGPFVEAMKDLLGATPLAELLSETPGVVEPLAEFFAGNLQPGRESGLSRDALFAAIVQLLRSLATQRPLVLVIEDLHLAGAETVELFAHVARCVPGHPILLVGVYAEDELGEESPLAAWIDSVADDETVTRLRLEPLPAAQVEELVRYVVRHEHTVRTLSPTLRTKSEGNPLIVLEVLSHLKERELLREQKGGLDVSGELDDIAVPSTVRDLVDLKLAGLDEEQRETLEAAAILGARFEASLLAEVLDETPIELSSRLAGLERKHRLLASSGKDAFRFASRQLFEAIYGAIPESLREEYHALVADTLLEEDEPAGPSAYALLHHLFFADRVMEATPFLEDALDHMAANFHASYAAPFLEKVSGGLADAPAPKRFALAMRLWAFYDLLASRKDEMRILELARDLADEMGEPGPRARVHAYRAGSYWSAGDYDSAFAEADAGLALAREAGDRMWEATCHHTLGVVAFRRGQLEKCAGEFREALAIRREIGDRRGEASTLQALTIVMPGIGEGERVLETMQESLRIWRELGERRGEAAMLMMVGNHLVDAARYDEGLQHLAQAIEGHRDCGAVISEALALTNLGRAQSIIGRIDDARASLGRALELFVDLSNPNGELAARTMLGSALGAYGEHEIARDHLVASIALAERTGNKVKLIAAHRELAAVLHHAGEREEAWAHFEGALAREEELKDAGSRVLTLGAAGKAALAEGDHRKAADLLREALPDARGGSGVYAPLILCRLARAYLDEGRASDAQECAREALERLEASGRVSPKDGPEIYYTLHQVREDGGFLARARELVEARARQIRHDSYREYFLTRTWPNAEILGPAADAADP